MENRIKERKPVDTPVLCRVPATPSTARVKDVSHSGCRLAFMSGGPVTEGSTVNIDLGGPRPVAGQVMWSNRTEAGIRFDRSLSNLQAIRIGLEEPPEPTIIVEEKQETLAGSIHHWFRAACDRFA